jgi:hypothetical protein
MKQINEKYYIARIVFTIGMLLSVLNFFIPNTIILYIGILVISLIYLTMGWYFLKSYFPEGHPLFLFLIGYLYSGVFIASVFYGANWPLATTFINIAPLWAVILLLLIIVNRKKMSSKNLIQFVVEGNILLLLAVLLIIFYNK